MTIKRSPAIKPEHRAKYEKISKADLVEAFRDFARDIGGFGETDESLWFAELERRVEIVRRERNAGNPMLFAEPIKRLPIPRLDDTPPFGGDFKKRLRKAVQLWHVNAPNYDWCMDELTQSCTDAEWEIVERIFDILNKNAQDVRENPTKNHFTLNEAYAMLANIIEVSRPDSSDADGGEA